MKLLNGAYLLLSLCVTTSCTFSRTIETTRTVTTEVRAQAHALVYKTRNDYSHRVPVLMDDSKTRIVSYPDPADLIANGKLVLPTPLHDGYLLDNRGIGPNVVFLKYTYEEYAAFKTVPAMSSLLENILDKSPLTELWDCGYRSFNANETTELNKLIETGLDKQKALIRPLKAFM